MRLKISILECWIHSASNQWSNHPIEMNPPFSAGSPANCQMQYDETSWFLSPLTELDTLSCVFAMAFVSEAARPIAESVENQDGLIGKLDTIQSNGQSRSMSSESTRTAESENVVVVPIAEEKPWKVRDDEKPLKPTVPKPSAKIEHIDIVPIAQARPLIAIDHDTDVTPDRALLDQSERDIVTTTSQADQDARREGSFASSILHVVGINEIAASRAPFMGLTTRIVQALFSVRTGATASAAPNAPDWDIQYTELSNTAGAIRRYPSHLPVYIPSDMPLEPALALASLFVPGGAGAYDWRFGIEDPRVACMPACTRYRHPGGTNRVLLIFDRPVPGAVFGGAALTEQALSALEEYYRLRWASSYWSQAYRSLAAIALVRAAPQPVDPITAIAAPNHRHSANVSIVDSKRASVNQAPVPSLPYVSAPYVDPEIALRRLSPYAPDALVKIGAVAGAPSGVCVEWNWDAKSARFTWVQERESRVFETDIARVLGAIASQKALPPHVALSLRALRQQFAGFILRDKFPARAREPVEPSSEMLNSGSFRDNRSVSSMAGFDLRRSVCLIANVHIPGPKKAIQ